MHIIHPLTEVDRPNEMRSSVCFHQGRVNAWCSRSKYRPYHAYHGATHTMLTLLDFVVDFLIML